MKYADTLTRMTSGECKWVGDVSVHVYRWSPMKLVNPEKHRYAPCDDPKWRVVTPDSETSLLGLSEACEEIRRCVAEAKKGKFDNEDKV